MPDAPDLRVSDADRERVATSIRDHYAAGRLDSSEFEDRLHAAYSAKTESELATIQADLPALTDAKSRASKAPASPEEMELAERHARLERRLLHRAGGAAGLFLLTCVVWLADGSQGSFWPKWVLVVMVLSIARPAWNLWGPSPDLDSVEKDLKSTPGSRRRPPGPGPRRPGP